MARRLGANAYDRTAKRRLRRTRRSGARQPPARITGRAIRAAEGSSRSCRFARQPPSLGAPESLDVSPSTYGPAEHRDNLRHETAVLRLSCRPLLLPMVHGQLANTPTLTRSGLIRAGG